MMVTEEEALAFLNKRIREEHGNPVKIDNLFIDSQVDSFGMTVIFLDMDDKYHCFNNEWFKTVDWKSTTVESIVKRAVDGNS